jgi:hypothetical protein
LNLRFLYFLLQVQNLPSLAKGVKPGINRNDVYAIPVSIPPIEEQRRIVAILDEAFEAIDKAKANTEKNIQNARELFDSYLKNVFSNLGPDWEEKRFDEVCVLQRGFDLPKRARKPGHFALVTSNGITDRINEFKVKGPGVVTGRSGTIGYLHYIDEDYWPLNTALYIKDFRGNNERCIYYFLKQFDLSRFSSGTGVPTLNRNHVHGELVAFPMSLTEQSEIAASLDILSSHFSDLENRYLQQLEKLDETRKAVLQKAFSGELSKPKSNVIPFPQRVTGISATDLHAGIISTAFKMHKEKGRLLHFHHVKAEKIAHMAEAFLGIDLEREPSKMAAGPNDFPRIHKVEHRAKKANYFHVEKQNVVYTYRPGNKIDSIISKTENALGKKFAELEDLIEKMVPMDTKQAEILATTFAAWNNLLVDGKNPTDEDIVFEARENWHPEKRKIDRERFFKAIQWMRDENIVPKGKGKRVNAKKE